MHLLLERGECWRSRVWGWMNKVGLELRLGLGTHGRRAWNLRLV